MTIKDELLSLKNANDDGLLYAPDVVQWARQNPRSALHKSLEWDDAKAAEEYRVWQVRKLIQIHVVSDAGLPQMVSLSIDRTGQGGYRSIDDVAADKNLTDILLRDALAELERVQAKFNRVQELASVWAAVQSVKSRRLGKIAENRAAA